MSKRDEGARVATYIEQGYAPEAVRNYLCLLGWSPKDNREKIDIDEVVKLFELEKINRRNAAFDLNKCFWLNGQYIAQMSLERFTELARPFLEKAKIDISDEKYLREVLAIVKEKIKLFKDVPEWTAYFFTEDYEFDPAAVEKVFGKPEAATHLSALRDEFAKIDKWNVETLESTLKKSRAETWLQDRRPRSSRARRRERPQRSARVFITCSKSWAKSASSRASIE